MKILLLSNMYPSKKDGLFGVFVKNFKEKLELQGAVFTAIVVIRGKTANPFFKLIRYGVYYVKAIIKGVFSKSDIIYVHFLSHNAPVIIVLARFFRKKIVVNIHGSDITKYDTGSWIGRLNRKALNSCKLIVVPSLYFSEILKEKYLTAASKKIIVYPSGGIDLSLFKSEKQITSPEISNLSLVLTSRIDSGKGWDVFLQGVSLLKKEGHTITATIIGQGNKEDEMLKLINTLHLEKEVFFLGLLPQQEISKIYTKQHVFVFPTLLNESLGLVGLEAMACGLPVIGSNIGAPSAYIKDGHNGFLFEPNNAIMLSKKVKSYINLTEVKKTALRQNAIETASMYDSTIVTEKLFKTLNSIC